jgi:hypothetical protein
LQLPWPAVGAEGSDQQGEEEQQQQLGDADSDDEGDSSSEEEEEEQQQQQEEEEEGEYSGAGDSEEEDFDAEGEQQQQRQQPRRRLQQTGSHRTAQGTEQQETEDVLRELDEVLAEDCGQRLEAVEAAIAGETSNQGLRLYTFPYACSATLAFGAAHMHVAGVFHWLRRVMEPVNVHGF